MAKQTLPTNYKDDVLATSMGKKRRYNLIQNDDGTISLEDATEYTQVGDNYGAAQLNATNQAVNESVDQAKIIDSLDDISANTQPGMVAGALAVAALYGKINTYTNNVLIGKWGSSWNLSTTSKNIGSSKPIVDDDCYKTTTGANATVTIKQSGLYCVTMYAQGAANQGASACIQAQVIADRTIIDDNYVLFGSQYSYNGFSANVNMSRIIYLENGTVLSPQIRKSDTSGASVTTGNSYMEIVKLA